jgi:LDH2 family malate/lactate/ureidoglycolate dehydrogenase
VQATGDRDFLTRAERLEQGVPLADALVEQLRGLSEEWGSGFVLVEQR